MKKSIIVLFVLFALLLASCDTGGQKSGNTVINVTWTNNENIDYSASSYLAILKGSFAYDRLPDPSDIVFNTRVYSSTDTVYADLSENGAYTAWVYFDQDANSTYSITDMPVGYKQFEFSGSATVDLRASY